MSLSTFMTFGISSQHFVIGATGSFVYVVQSLHYLNLLSW